MQELSFSEIHWGRSKSSAAETTYFSPGNKWLSPDVWQQTL